MPDFATVKLASKGREIEILQAMGIPSKSLDGKHHSCPGCGGKDRFRWDHEKACFFCGQGGTTTGGDVIDLLVHDGYSKREALCAVANYLELKPDTSPEAKAKYRRLRQQREYQGMEEAFLRELQISSMIVGQRVAGRILEHNQRFRKVRPEWQPMPDGSWEDEIKSVRRIQYFISKLYPTQGGGVA